MGNEEQLIRTELRFSDAAEQKVIRDEISFSGGNLIGEFDGMIEAMLPVSSLEVMKKYHILMDFPSVKTAVKKDTTLELMDIPVVTKKEITQAARKWIGQFKRKARRTIIDRKKNTFRNLQADEKAEVPKLEEAEPELFPDTAGDEPGTRDMPPPPPPPPQKEAEAPQDELYAIILKGPMDQASRTALDERSVQLTVLNDGDNEYAYTAFLKPDQYDFVKEMPIVSSVTPYEMENKLGESMVDRLSAYDPDMETLQIDRLFDIAVSEESHLEKVLSIIQSSGEAKIIDSGLNVIRIQANPDSALLSALAECPYVIAMSLYEPPSLFCDVSRKTIGIDYAKTPGTWWGEGETVGVIDSGIDATHSDLRTHITAALQYGAGRTEDHFGHGTHVAGIICGDGTASGGTITGMAPAASVLSLGIVDENGKLDLPVDIGKLLRIVTEKGAKIVNLSLGDKVSGEYHLGSLGVDKFIYENPEILVVVAAGNEGEATQGRLSYKKIGSPATAKNVLTVGATTGRRTTPQIRQTWGDRKPAAFPRPPLNAIPLMSPDEDHPSLTSSTGPTDFDSIKPEVVAPGTYILAPKAALSNVSPAGSEFYDANYTFKTGTSMAAPVVSGLAAVLREYLRKEHQCNNPSAALLKAIIVGHTHRITSYRTPPLDTTLSKVGFPDFDQGFGLVDLGKLLKERSLTLFFADIYNTDPKALESRTPFGGAIKSYRDYEVEVVDAAQDLSVTITWIDPPAKGVQNNLQLSVKTPDNEWKLGNMEHTYKKDADFDTLVDLKPLDKYNNTEKVLIPSPAPGKYRIKIAAQNTLSRQGYSLVVSGNITGFRER